jgi:pantoate kinase
MRQAGAFAPSHITGFFQIADAQKDPMHVGSLGAGVSLVRGIETVARTRKSGSNSLNVKINGSVSRSAQVSKHLTDVFLSHFDKMRDFQIEVEHRVEVPVGAGFGTSGGAALSLALALNELFELGLSTVEAAQLAHMAEIECKTGLGTVIAETCGGLEIRVEAGAPGVGKVEQLPTSEDLNVACLVFGPLSTRDYLADGSIRRKINGFGRDMVDRMLRDRTADSFMRISREFAEHVGLITGRVRRVFDATDKAGIVCSMPMFGESAFTLAETEDLPRVTKIFEEHGARGEIILSKVDKSGARLLR